MQLHGKIKLKLDIENYRDESYVAQTALMKSTNKNYTKGKLFKVKVCERQV